jgi:hypothetical protein
MIISASLKGFEFIKQRIYAEKRGRNTLEHLGQGRSDRGEAVVPAEEAHTSKKGK